MTLDARSRHLGDQVAAHRAGLGQCGQPWHTSAAYLTQIHMRTNLCIRFAKHVVVSNGGGPNLEQDRAFRTWDLDYIYTYSIDMQRFLPGMISIWNYQMAGCFRLWNGCLDLGSGCLRYIYV